MVGLKLRATGLCEAAENEVGNSCGLNGPPIEREHWSRLWKGPVMWLWEYEACLELPPWTRSQASLHAVFVKAINRFSLWFFDLFALSLWMKRRFCHCLGTIWSFLLSLFLKMTLIDWYKHWCESGRVAASVNKRIARWLCESTVSHGLNMEQVLALKRGGGLWWLTWVWI